MEKATAQKEHKSIYAALLQAKRDMGPVYKNASNPHFRSKYADLANVTETAEEPLQNNDILLSQPLVMIDGKLHVKTILHHVPSGTELEGAIEVMSKDPQDPQKMGASTTYCRRYGLLAILGIAPEDDDGNLASTPVARPVTTPSRPAPQATPAYTAAPTPSTKPANTKTWTSPEGEVIEIVPCEVPDCKKSVQLKNYKYNRKQHDGHTICRFHSENGDWRRELGLDNTNVLSSYGEDVDPDMIDAINESHPEYAHYKTNPDGSVERV